MDDALLIVLTAGVLVASFFAAVLIYAWAATNKLDDIWTV